MPPRVRRKGYGGLEDEAIEKILMRKQDPFVPGAVHETFVDYTTVRDGDDQYMAACCCGWHRMELRTRLDAEQAETMHKEIMAAWSESKNWAVIQMQLAHSEKPFDYRNPGGIHCTCGESFAGYPGGQDTAARRYYLHVAEQIIKALEDIQVS